MYYFASDIHLGAGDMETARATEDQFVEWLRRVGEDAKVIFLCGDIFDFWFEYKRVIPKGFTRTLGTINDLTRRGVRVVFMTGNHDMWVRDYLASECGMEIYTSPMRFMLGEKVVHVAHGDNLNVWKDWKLKALNSLFRSKSAYALTQALIHPNLIIRFGRWWSGKSRNKHAADAGQNTIDGFGVRELIEYAKGAQQGTYCDYYIYGHLHQHLEYQDDLVHVLFMNDWSSEPYFAKMDQEGVMSLERV